MLSRHLYEIDEVCLCLRYSLQIGDERKAVFWARELLLSNEEALLGKTAIVSWILYLGAPRIQWLDAWTNVGNDVGGCIRLVLLVEFCKLRTKVSDVRFPAMLKSFVLAARGTSESPSNENLNTGIETNNPYAIYWNLGTEKPVEVIGELCKFVDSPEIFDSLKAAMGAVGSHVKLMLAVSAVQVLCLEVYPAALVPTSHSTVAALLQDWERTIGRKSGRIYDIEICTFLSSERRKTQSEALRGSAIDIMKNGCDFWQTELSFVQEDDPLTEIAKRHFPDNLPSKWSLKEMSKSHPESSEPVEKTKRNKNTKLEEEQLKLIYNTAPCLRKSWARKLKPILKTFEFPTVL